MIYPLIQSRGSSTARKIMLKQVKLLIQVKSFQCEAFFQVEMPRLKEKSEARSLARLVLHLNLPTYTMH